MMRGVVRTLLLTHGAPRRDALRRAAGDAWPAAEVSELRSLDELRAALHAVRRGTRRGAARRLGRASGRPPHAAPASAEPEPRLRLVILLDLVAAGSPSVVMVRAVLDAAREPDGPPAAARVVAYVADVGGAIAALSDGADACLLPQDAPARWQLVLHEQTAPSAAGGAAPLRPVSREDATSAGDDPTAAPLDARASRGRLVVRHGRRAIALELGAVRAVEAVGNYVRLVAPCGRHLVRGTLAEFEARLAPLAFVRVHRRTLVRLALVRELVVRPSGDAVATLACGLRVRVSRTYRAALERAWGAA